MREGVPCSWFRVAEGVGNRNAESVSDYTFLHSGAGLSYGQRRKGSGTPKRPADEDVRQHQRPRPSRRWGRVRHRQDRSQQEGGEHGQGQPECCGAQQGIQPEERHGRQQVQRQLDAIKPERDAWRGRRRCRQTSHAATAIAAYSVSQTNVNIMPWRAPKGASSIRLYQLPPMAARTGMEPTSESSAEGQRQESHQGGELPPPGRLVDSPGRGLQRGHFAGTDLLWTMAGARVKPMADAVP